MNFKFWNNFWFTAKLQRYREFPHMPHCFSYPWHRYLALLWCLCQIYETNLSTLLLTKFQILFWFHQVYDQAIQDGCSGLPWWHSGWESACQCRGHVFEPWSGKIPHATEQLGPWATITEPARLEPVLRNKRGRDSERPARRDEEWPPLAATKESPRTETKTQHSHK